MNLHEQASFSGASKLTNKSFWYIYNYTNYYQRFVASCSLKDYGDINNHTRNACFIANFNKDHTKAAIMILEITLKQMMSLNSIDDLDKIDDFPLIERLEDSDIKQKSLYRLWLSLDSLTICLADMYSELEYYKEANNLYLKIENANIQGINHYSALCSLAENYVKLMNEEKASEYFRKVLEERESEYINLSSWNWLFMYDYDDDRNLCGSVDL